MTWEAARQVLRGSAGANAAYVYLTGDPPHAPSAAHQELMTPVSTHHSQQLHSDHLAPACSVKGPSHAGPSGISDIDWLRQVDARAISASCGGGWRACAAPAVKWTIT